MTIVRRGASTYVSSAAALSHNVPLPTGSQIGDLVILAASNPSFSAAFTLPGSSMLNAGSNTMRYGVSKKRLIAADITQGSLTVGISTSQEMTAVCVGYSSAGDFGTPGTVWEKGGVSLASTTSPLVGNNSPNDVLAFSLIKHSGTSQSRTGTTPSITSLATSIRNGPGVPSAAVGVYTGTPSDIVTTWSVASSNGVGFQIAVLDTPPANSVDWTDVNPTTIGATISGIVTISDVGDYNVATFPQGAGTATLDWTLDSLDKYSVRYYLHAPAAWSATAAEIFRALNGATFLTGVAIGGTGSPGQLRWLLTATTEAFRTASNLLSNSTIYRVEIQADTVNNTIRGAVFQLGATVPLYDSGLISGLVGSLANKFSFGRVKTMASLPDFSISRVKIINSVGDWIGRHVTDPLPPGPSVLGVWNGGSLAAVEVLGVWNGTQIKAADVISIV